MRWAAEIPWSWPGRISRAAACAKETILLRADGVGTLPLLEGILKLLPLDENVPNPVQLVERTSADGDLAVPLWEDYKAIVAKYDARGAAAIDWTDRYKFYTMATPGLCRRRHWGACPLCQHSAAKGRRHPRDAIKYGAVPRSLACFCGTSKRRMGLLQENAASPRFYFPLWRFFMTWRIRTEWSRICLRIRRFCGRDLQQLVICQIFQALL